MCYSKYYSTYVFWNKYNVFKSLGRKMIVLIFLEYFDNFFSFTFSSSALLCIISNITGFNIHCFLNECMFLKVNANIIIMTNYLFEKKLFVNTNPINLFINNHSFSVQNLICKECNTAFPKINLHPIPQMSFFNWVGSL